MADYTGIVMIRRILPLVMVLTIAVCPVALELCQVACAQHEHDVAVTSAPAGHHHHAEPDDAMVAQHHADDATSAAAPAWISASTVGDLPHGCLHGEALPAFVGTNFQVALAPEAVVSPLFALPEPTSGTRFQIDTASAGPSPPLALTTQLRV